MKRITTAVLPGPGGKEKMKEMRSCVSWIRFAATAGTALLMIAAALQAARHGSRPAARNVPVDLRWTDFTSWVSKREPNEPEVDTRDYLVKLKVPIVLIHSIHDEYDSIDKVKAMFEAVPGSKRFYAVDAPNHRFNNKIQEVLSLADISLEWMVSQGKDR